MFCLTFFRSLSLFISIYMYSIYIYLSIYQYFYLSKYQPTFSGQTRVPDRTTSWRLPPTSWRRPPTCWRPARPAERIGATPPVDWSRQSRRNLTRQTRLPTSLSIGMVRHDSAQHFYSQFYAFFRSYSF